MSASSRGGCANAPESTSSNQTCIRPFRSGSPPVAQGFDEMEPPTRFLIGVPRAGNGRESRTVVGYLDPNPLARRPNRQLEVLRAFPGSMAHAVRDQLAHQQTQRLEGVRVERVRERSERVPSFVDRGCLVGQSPLDVDPRVRRCADQRSRKGARPEEWALSQVRFDRSLKGARCSNASVTRSTMRLRLRSACARSARWRSGLRDTPPSAKSRLLAIPATFLPPQSGSRERKRGDPRERVFSQSVPGAGDPPDFEPMKCRSDPRRSPSPGARSTPTKKAKEAKEHDRARRSPRSPTRRAQDARAAFEASPRTSASGRIDPA